MQYKQLDTSSFLDWGQPPLWTSTAEFFNDSCHFLSGSSLSFSLLKEIELCKSSGGCAETNWRTAFQERHIAERPSEDVYPVLEDIHPVLQA